MAGQIDLDQILLRVSTFVECAIFNNSSDPVIADQVIDCTFTYNIGQKIFPEKNAVGIELLLGIDAIDENEVSLGAGGSFRLRFVFEVKNLDELLISREEPITATPDLYLTLVGVAYSTARGMIIAKTASTLLEGVTIPIVDVRELISGKRKK